MKGQPQRQEEEKEKLILKGAQDPVWFFRFFLSKWFPSEIPWVHRGILAIMLKQTEFLKKYGELDKIFSNFTYVVNPDDDEELWREESIFFWDGDKIGMRLGTYTLIMLPRGYSKTTLLNGISVFNIAYELIDYTTYVSETATHAKRQLGNVKLQFEQNELLCEVFGNIVPERMDKRKWTEEEAKTLTDIYQNAVGRGGQIRGGVIDGDRPKRIILDDVEDVESVATQMQREKTSNWFFASVVPALAEMYDGADIVCLGTLLGEGALLDELSKDPDWTTVRFGALDKQGDPLWARRMDHKAIAKKKAFFARNGKLASYYREYHNLLRGEDSSKFKEKYFNYGYLQGETLVAASLAVDPAISKEDGSDECAFGVQAVTNKGRIMVLESTAHVGLEPSEQVDLYFYFALKYKDILTKYGVEANAYQKALAYLIKGEMFKRKCYFEIQALPAKTEKVQRILGILQPLYSAGIVAHRKKFRELEGQLLDWPFGGKDRADVLAQGCQLLDAYSVYRADDVDELEEDQYESIDELLGDNWGMCP